MVLIFVTRDRIRAAILAITLQGLMGYALLSQLGVGIATRPETAQELFEITPQRLSPAVRTPPSKPERAKGAPAPPNLRAQPVEIVAPRPVLPPIQPPIIAAPIAGAGVRASAGAASLPGPGTGAGGEGAGTGAGGAGEGDFSPPRWRSGRIKDSDYPQALGDEGVGRRITVQFTVAETGRVTGCTVLASSGLPDLDRATCQAIERRYRFKPSRDANGNPVTSMVAEDHVWRKGRD